MIDGDSARAGCARLACHRVRSRAAHTSGARIGPASAGRASDHSSAMRGAACARVRECDDVSMESPWCRKNRVPWRNLRQNLNKDFKSSDSLILVILTHSILVHTYRSIAKSTLRTKADLIIFTVPTVKYSNFSIFQFVADHRPRDPIPRQTASPNAVKIRTRLIACQPRPLARLIDFSERVPARWASVKSKTANRV